MKSDIRNHIASVPYFLFYLLFWAATSFFEPYLSLFLSSRGLSGTSIGMINCSIYVVTIIASILVGTVSDKTGQSKSILIVLLIGAIASVWNIKYSYGIVIIFITCVFYGLCSSPATDLADKIVVENEPNISKNYSFLRMGGAVGYLIGTLIAGNIIKSSGFITSMNLYIMVMLVCILVCFLMKNVKYEHKRNMKRIPISQIFSNPKAYFIYGSMAMWGVVFTGALSFISFYIDKCGCDTSFTAILVATAMAGQITTYFLLPLLYRKFSLEICFGLGMSMLSLRLLAITMCNILPLPVLLLLTFVGGSSEPAVGCSIVTMISETFPKDVSSTAQTLKSVANKGIGSSIGTLTLGIMFDNMKPFSVMMIATISCLVFGCIVILWHLSLQKKLTQV